MAMDELITTLAEVFKDEATIIVMDEEGDMVIGDGLDNTVPVIDRNAIRGRDWEWKQTVASETLYLIPTNQLIITGNVWVYMHNGNVMARYGKAHWPSYSYTYIAIELEI